MQDGLFKFYRVQIPRHHRQTSSNKFVLILYENPVIYERVCLWFLDSVSVEWPWRREELRQKLNTRLQVKVERRFKKSFLKVTSCCLWNMSGFHLCQLPKSGTYSQRLQKQQGLFPSSPSPLVSFSRRQPAFPLSARLLLAGSENWNPRKPRDRIAGSAEQVSSRDFCTIYTSREGQNCRRVVKS